MPEIQVAVLLLRLESKQFYFYFSRIQSRYFIDYSTDAADLYISCRIIWPSRTATGEGFELVMASLDNEGDLE
jgi:hypothetical protein